VLVPVAAVGAVVAAIVTTGDFSTTGSGGGGQAAATAGGEAAKTTREAAGGGTTPTTFGQDMLLAKGSPEDVVARLRRKGIDARVVGDHVEVHGATRAEVDRALGRSGRTGAVRIVIVK
jgi:hypothetical protein